MIFKFKIITFSLVLFFISAAALSQESIRVMQYNLLFYGIYTDFCTVQNNNANAKDEHLRTIVGHFQPDIFAVNEMGRGSHNQTRLLNNVLNIEGVDYFEHATYTNTGGGWLTNALFFDSRKFGLHNEAIVSTEVRDINLYTLYYKAEDLAQTQDTVFITAILAHLKAGSSPADLNRRALEVENVMNYLNTRAYEGNIMFIGDFNMKSSYEEAYQMMINHYNPNIRFYDPIDKPGQWGHNSAMAPYHTQSPRTGSHPCFVTGGLDDRYDFIMLTSPMMEGLRGFKYMEDSYTTIGQDGLRYNGNLINPTNNSQPPEIINALYNMSDHLPVMLDLEVVDLITSYDIQNLDLWAIRVINPIGKSVSFEINALKGGVLDLEVISMSGQVLMDSKIMIEPGLQTIDTPSIKLKPGVYILKFRLPGGALISEKVVKI